MECKLCLKKFCNGKALGRHMRTHYATLPLPTKTPQKKQQPTAKTTCYYGLRKNPKKSLRIADRKFLDDSVESTRGHKKTVFSAPIEEYLNNAAGSVFTEEEDVALCLVMLSRDVWGESHKCEECDKVFKSSQGLGSHMNAHFKKIKNNLDSVGDVQQNESFTTTKKKKIKKIVKQEEEALQCPLCSRKFNSAQALGGHKRWHLLLAKSAQYSTIDLNLPPAAAMEHQD